LLLIEVPGAPGPAVGSASAKWGVPGAVRPAELGFPRSSVLLMSALQGGTMQLRAYQNDQVSDLREGIRQQFLVQMLMSPTGSGKTEVAK